jgi:thiol-disulfide isomerase/thioredoxin
MFGRKWIVALVIGPLLVAAGCGGDKAPDNPYIGNMDDFSYSGQVTPDGVTYRVSASAKQVSVAQFDGRFVWTDYAAPWCQPCVTQAQAIKSLERTLGDRVVFLTVITSASEKYEDVPDQQTARAWAQRFGLDPDRVVAATNLWAWKIPTHILYSPKGQTLYRSTGYLPAEEIQGLLNRYIIDWEKWDRTGEKADWMR